MIFSRAVKVTSISMRIIRAGRFIPRITGAACLVTGVSAAVVFPAGSAVAQASATCNLAYSQTIVVTSLSDTRTGSLRAALNSAGRPIVNSGHHNTIRGNRFRPIRH